ncbi:MAG TPA: copper homeostasis protein CutC [Verrucomicrobiae bacterium]|nr:copper homeostasis protein CutC [Verrucomicrobiae bacterium]
MSLQPLLEITVESLDTALAAERGGADRIELCAELIHGGITPTVATLRKVYEELEIPIFCIIRPRAGNFVYNEKEFVRMKRDIAVARDLGIEGVVLGVLCANGFVDAERTAELVQWARPLEVTFHRAFDETPDQMQALEEVIATQATRILTTGAAATAIQGAERLKRLVDSAGKRIVIMPGGGLDAGNVSQVVAQTGAREFHSGLGSVLPYGSSNLQRFETEIRAMKRHLEGVARTARVESHP